ncbi:nitrogen fixation protein NifQ [Sodalis ligni]|uniref:nitrogen fixation protein NifQ n=1 Tax=Sodalis ligni TaxID=2697027 RepID=UPI001BDE4B5C|nr:nitrogen fixation protein NifQ [Sodalis ligni]QWA13538.1 nitrogen fixation protein NifQ [Sodalis ligni]
MVTGPTDNLLPARAEIWLRRLMLTHLQGGARFPADMGLSPAAYRQLAQRVLLAPDSRPHNLRQQDELIAMLQRSRRQERQGLAEWLQQYMVPRGAPLNQLIARGSLGFSHLWQDLGLSSREELRELMTDCFPELVRMNHRNMRWKKFFYRQLCLADSGEINCRSPSCEQCIEQESCFAPED